MGSGVEQSRQIAAGLGAKGKQRQDLKGRGWFRNQRDRPDKATDTGRLAREAQTKSEAKGLCKGQG